MAIRHSAIGQEVRRVHEKDGKHGKIEIGAPTSEPNLFYYV
jgi:hypothetical protein